MEYYTYAYLREDGTPYYIGKGKAGRINNNLHNINLPPENRRIYLKKKGMILLVEHQETNKLVYLLVGYFPKHTVNSILNMAGMITKGTCVILC